MPLPPARKREEIRDCNLLAMIQSHFMIRMVALTAAGVRYIGLAPIGARRLAPFRNMISVGRPLDPYRSQVPGREQCLPLKIFSWIPRSLQLAEDPARHTAMRASEDINSTTIGPSPFNTSRQMCCSDSSNPVDRFVSWMKSHRLDCGRWVKPICSCPDLRDLNLGSHNVPTRAPCARPPQSVLRGQLAERQVLLRNCLDLRSVARRDQLSRSR